MAKVILDFSESAKVLAPVGEYSLRLKKKEIGVSKTSRKPMITCVWEPFNPRDPSVTMEQLEKCEIKSFISLAPNALFTLKQVYAAGGVELECNKCHREYNAAYDKCPDCEDMQFLVDYDALDTMTVGAFVTIEKDQKGERDINVIERFFNEN